MINYSDVKDIDWEDLPVEAQRTFFEIDKMSEKEIEMTCGKGNGLYDFFCINTTEDLSKKVKELNEFFYLRGYEGINDSVYQTEDKCYVCCNQWDDPYPAGYLDSIIKEERFTSDGIKKWEELKEFCKRRGWPEPSEDRRPFYE